MDWKDEKTTRTIIAKTITAARDKDCIFHQALAHSAL